MKRTLVLLTVLPLLAWAEAYEQRVKQVRETPGLVAFWDFVKRDPADRRFDAWRASGDKADFRLDARNYVLDYWGRGREATYQDFPLLGEGPFGEAVRIVAEKDPDFRPLLLVPRERLHDSGLDVKGPGRSVSMVVWLRRESGNHAIAGIWHEGTDLHSGAAPVTRVERGRRQYALFAGLAANNGASAVHVSENGAASFGDRYARNLAVTPEVIPTDSWAVVGFVFDNARNTATAYIDGKASDFWIEDNLDRHPFFQWPYKAWQNGGWNPPESKPRRREVLERRTGGERVELHTFEFTKVRVTLQGRRVLKRELVALRANPFWFPHDLYTPPAAADGGPFTIGRVIHTSRSVGFTGWIGGVAVFDRALTPKQMRRLATIAKSGLIQR